ERSARVCREPARPDGRAGCPDAGPARHYLYAGECRYFALVLGRPRPVMDVSAAGTHEPACAATALPHRTRSANWGAALCAAGAGSAARTAHGALTPAESRRLRLSVHGGTTRQLHANPQPARLARSRGLARGWAADPWHVPAASRPHAVARQ